MVAAATAVAAVEATAAVVAADVATAASVADAKPQHKQANFQKSAWGNSGAFFVGRPGGSKKQVASDPSQGETPQERQRLLGKSCQIEGDLERRFSQ